MPSIAGSGVFGWPKEGAGDTPSQALNIYGVLPATTAWVRAKYVWAWCADVNAWTPVWAGTVDAPTSATATWTTLTSVTVAWVAPPISAATGWTVKRSDGSVVGIVGAGVLSIVDSTPLLSSVVMGNKTLGAYTVTGSDGVLTSPATATNTVTWNLDAASPSYNISATYINADGFTNNVDATLTWAQNATYGRPDRWGIWDSQAGSWITTTLDGAATSYAFTSLMMGQVRVFRVVPFTLTSAGAYVQAGNGNDITVNVPMPRPTSVKFATSGIVGGTNVSYNHPRSVCHPNASVALTCSCSGVDMGYETQYSFDNVNWTVQTARTGCGGSPNAASTSIVANGTYWSRIRALGPGGASAWAQGAVATTTNTYSDTTVNGSAGP